MIWLVVMSCLPRLPVSRIFFPSELRVRYISTDGYGFRPNGPPARENSIKRCQHLESRLDPSAVLEFEPRPLAYIAVKSQRISPIHRRNPILSSYSPNPNGLSSSWLSSSYLVMDLYSLNIAFQLPRSLSNVRMCSFTTNPISLD